SVRRPVKPVADGLLACPHVNHVGVRWSHRKRPDGGDSFPVEDRMPNLSAIGSLPDSAARCAKVVGIRMAWHARYSRDSTGSKGTDQPPVHGRELAGVEFLGASEPA